MKIVSRWLNFIKYHPSPWKIFFVTAPGVMMSSLDAGIVNVALPTITQRFHATLSNAQWLVSGYLFSLCVFLPFCAYLSDRFTRRRIYLMGFALFTITSMLCGIAFSLPSLIVFRFLQGLGAAMIISNNQATILSVFPKEHRGRALGVNSMTVSFGAIAGPSIGGLLIGLLGWRSIFYINVPIGIVGCYLGYLVLPKNEVKQKKHFDLLGTSLFTLGLGSLIISLSNIFAWGLVSMRVWILNGLGVFGLIFFYLWERKQTSPLIDFSLYSIQKFFQGNLIALFLFMGLAINNIMLPFCLQNQLAMTPIAVGLILFVPPILIVILAPVSGFMADYFEYSILTTIGIVILFIGFVLQTLIIATTPLYMIIMQQILIGTGFALIQSPNNLSIFSEVPNEKINLATSMASLVRNMAKIFGIVFGTFAFEFVNLMFLGHNATAFHVNNSAFFAGFRAAYILALCLIIVAFYLSYRELKVWRQHRKDGSSVNIAG